MRNTTVLSSVAATILAGLTAWVLSSAETAVAINLLPDNWDTVIIAALVALILSWVAVKTVPRIAWSLVALIGVGALLGDSYGVWDLSGMSKVLFVLVAVVPFGVRVANYMFGEQVSAANTSVPPTGADYTGPPQGH